LKFLFPHATPRRPSLVLSCIAGAVLAACGGGSDGAPADVAAASVVGGTDSATAAATTAAMATVEALPSFHMAAAELGEPSNVDVGGGGASARVAPQRFGIDASVAGLSTAGLTPQTLALRLADGARMKAQAVAGPQAQAITATVYTPAQIRAAYGLSDLPASGATLSAAAAAALGAGQTIYVIDAYDNPNALSDLNKFSTKFGLPTCTSAPLTAASTLPLAAAGSSCTFAVASTDAGGALKTAAPAYGSAWAPEIALDVQWAHAIAPLARIVLIETSDAQTNTLLGGVALANKMGAGVVSMSFGASESTWVLGADAAFAAAGMTYVAASGDSGAQVNWPAVSPKVLAVGGTSLQWSGGGTRYEAAWSGAGGGVSAYESLPTWQSAVTLPGLGKPARRAVSDVAFNANPSTGQYVALTTPGAATTSWNSYGGTSIGAPQWAGLLAVANAQRVAAAKALLGDVHATIYTGIGAVPGSYAAAFGDVVDGNDGSCATCAAAAGYDQPTGWGTPNAAGLLPALGGAATGGTPPVAVAPVVPGGTLVAKTGVALSQSLGITAPSGVTTTYKLTGAPGGLTVGATGALAWAKPATGSYTFGATATTSAGQSASASYTLKIIPYTAPAFSGATALTGTAGKAFAATLTASNPNGGTLSWSMTGGPDGLALGGAGALAWAAPVAGSYTLSVKVADSYGLSATRAYTLKVAGAANAAPTLASATLTAKAGAAFSATLAGKDADGDALSYTMTGAPSGLTLSAAGVLNWAKAAKGTYALKVTARDARGLAGAVATITLSVKA
jgi:hypothetical protein